MAFGVPESNIVTPPIMQDLDAAHSTAQHDLGYKVLAQDGREYTYAFLSTAMTAATVAGYPAFALGGIVPWTVTSTYPGNKGAGFAGVFTMILAAGNNYVWIQTAGRVACTLMSTNYSASQALTAIETGMLSDVAQTASTTYLVQEQGDMLNQKVAVALEAGTTAYGDTSKADVMLMRSR